MRVVAVAIIALCAVSPAVAQEGTSAEQAATMKAKFARGDRSFPTGYEISGPTHYRYDALRGYVRLHGGERVTAQGREQEFWRRQDGGAGNGGQLGQ